MNIQASSFYDLGAAMPIDIRSVAIGVSLGFVASTFVRSTTLLQSSWAASPLLLTGSNTKVNSLNISESSTVTEANQWNQTHQMVNVAATNPPSLRKVIFAKAGHLWQNQVEIDFGLSSYNSVQLTLRDNLGTSGQFLNGATGTIPAYSLGSSITGVNILYLTFPQPGTYVLALAMVLSSNWNSFEMEFVVLP